MNTKILFIADVVGEPGLEIMSSLLPALISDSGADLVIANGENGAAGKGMTVDLVREYQRLGIDVITSGNHIWDKHQIRKDFKNFPFLLRPLNYPPGAGGQGSFAAKTRRDIAVTVINLQGRTFMPPIDCPFRALDRELKRHPPKSQVVIIDMHAESTAEKQALAWHLDGRVSAVIGTHTHVQTADERILPNGTGYITDAGMTGSFDSVIGMHTDTAIRRFMTQTPHPFQLAAGNLRMNAVTVDVDVESGNCTKIERLSLP